MTERTIDGRLYQLTQAALAERLEYEADYGDSGCSCHQCAPCGNCVHTGNPLNQDEDETAWEPVGCACTVTQGREGERGSWCVDCGRKVYEVETRPCSGCRHYRKPFGGSICVRHLMVVTPSMLVTFGVDDGTCWEAVP